MLTVVQIEPVRTRWGLGDFAWAWPAIIVGQVILGALALSVRGFGPNHRADAIDIAIVTAGSAGNIFMSLNGGAAWTPVSPVPGANSVTIDPTRPQVVYAGSATGIYKTNDAGATWRVHTRGLHATYCRATAATHDAVLVSASEGPRGRQSAVYRTNLDATERFDRVTEWIDGNVDSHALDARGDLAAFGTPRGEIYESTDSGITWNRTRTGLPAITSLSIVERASVAA